MCFSPTPLYCPPLLPRPPPAILPCAHALQLTISIFVPRGICYSLPADPAFIALTQTVENLNKELAAAKVEAKTEVSSAESRANKATSAASAASNEALSTLKSQTYSWASTKFGEHDALIADAEKVALESAHLAVRLVCTLSTSQPSSGHSYALIHLTCPPPPAPPPV